MVGRSIYRCRVINSLVIRHKAGVGTIVEPLRKTAILLLQIVDFQCYILLSPDLFSLVFTFYFPIQSV